MNSTISVHPKVANGDRFTAACRPGRAVLNIATADGDGGALVDVHIATLADARALAAAAVKVLDHMRDRPITKTGEVAA